MILDVKPIHFDTYTCLEDGLASLAQFWKTDHILMFAESWGFKYTEGIIENSVNRTLGYKMKTNIYNIFKCLYKYHGIKIEMINAKTNLDIISELRVELILDNPVCIDIDAFYCHWNPAFQKYHDTHYFLMVGLDEESRRIAVIDPYLSKDIKYISFEDFKLGCNQYMTCRLKDNVVCPDVREILNNTVMNLGMNSNSTNAFNKIRCFAYEVKESLDLDLEVKGYDDILSSPFFMRLIQIGWERMNYAKAIKYIADLYDNRELEKLCEEVNRLGKRWLGIRMMIGMRYSIMDNSMLVDIAEKKIREIADEEEKVACIVTKYRW